MASGLKPRGRDKGRRTKIAGSLIVAALFGFLLVAAGVIARRTFGIAQSKEIRARETQRDALEASRVKLEEEIRDASSRTRLGPVAEKRLHMYVPPDSQVIILKRPTPPKS